MTAPGWYPDPAGRGGQRWWDGTAWTEHHHAAQNIEQSAVTTKNEVDHRSGLAYADVGQRLCALLIDVAVNMVVLIPVAILVVLAFALPVALALFVLFVAVVLYVAFPVGLTILGEGGPLGQTPGKHLMGIKVVGPTAGPIGYGRAALRYVGRFADFTIGLFWALWDSERRTFHDMIADTRVVVTAPAPKGIGVWLRTVRG